MKFFKKNIFHLLKNLDFIQIFFSAFNSLYTVIFTCHIWNMREVLVSRWKKLKKNIADFHVLGLFMAKNMIWAIKNFRLPRAVAVAVNVAVRKICTSPTGSALKVRNLKFGLPESFGPIWCTSYSEFWNSGSLR
jgi:hypothetical protein